MHFMWLYIVFIDCLPDFLDKSRCLMSSNLIYCNCVLCFLFVPHIPKWPHAFINIDMLAGPSSMISKNYLWFAVFIPFVLSAMGKNNVNAKWISIQESKTCFQLFIFCASSREKYLKKKEAEHNAEIIHEFFKNGRNTNKSIFWREDEGLQKEEFDLLSIYIWNLFPFIFFYYYTIVYIIH